MSSCFKRRRSPDRLSFAVAQSLAQPGTGRKRKAEKPFTPQPYAPWRVSSASNIRLNSLSTAWCERGRNSANSR